MIIFDVMSRKFFGNEESLDKESVIHITNGFNLANFEKVAIYIVKNKIKTIKIHRYHKDIGFKFCDLVDIYRAGLDAVAKAIDPSAFGYEVNFAFEYDSIDIKPLPEFKHTSMEVWAPEDMLEHVSLSMAFNYAALKVANQKCAKMNILQKLRVDKLLSTSCYSRG